VKAVVMAGGQGTRLRPLTSNQPKPMVPVVNKPCIHHILELVQRHGITEVVMTLAFLPRNENVLSSNLDNTTPVIPHQPAAHI